MKLKNDVKYAMEQLHISTLRKHQSKPIDSILDGHDTPAFLCCPSKVSGAAELHHICSSIRALRVAALLEMASVCITSMSAFKARLERNTACKFGMD